MLYWGLEQAGWTRSRFKSASTENSFQFWARGIQCFSWKYEPEQGGATGLKDPVHWHATALLLKKLASQQRLYSKCGCSKSWANLYQMDDREERNESDPGKGLLAHMKSSWHTPPPLTQLPCVCITMLAHAQERVRQEEAFEKLKTILWICYICLMAEQVDS